MEAVEKLILAIGAAKAAAQVMPHGFLDVALEALNAALVEAVNQATADAEKDAE